MSITTHLSHPQEHLLRTDRFPHIWCPTCGIGTVVKCFVDAIDRANMDYDKMAIVSGIGCTGRAAGYVKLDSYHTTHGRAIPFATGSGVDSIGQAWQLVRTQVRALGSDWLVSGDFERTQ